MGERKDLCKSRRVLVDSVLSDVNGREEESERSGDGVSDVADDPCPGLKRRRLR